MVDFGIASIDDWEDVQRVIKFIIISDDSIIPAMVVSNVCESKAKTRR